MALGLAVFFGALLLLATRQFASQALRRPVIRRALVDSLQVRLFSILVFPLVLINDLICGGLSVLAALVLFDSAGPFVVTTAATLFEGALLTVELACIAYVAFARRRASGYALTPTGICVGCGYELRGCTSNRCPECGRVADSVA